jgi:hypothetical protein
MIVRSDQRSGRLHFTVPLVRHWHFYQSECVIRPIFVDLVPISYCLTNCFDPDPFHARSPTWTWRPPTKRCGC